MKPIALFTDAAADIPSELFRSIDATIIPMVYSVGDSMYVHAPSPAQMPLRAYYTILKNGAFGSTSAISTERYIEYFEQALLSGRDALYIGLSSHLSSSFDYAQVAAQELSQKYRDNKVVCIDSLSASAGQTLLLLLARDLHEQGQGIDQIAAALIDARPYAGVWVSVEDIAYLQRGGRVGKTTAALSVALGIRPLLHIDDAGRIVLGGAGTVRGKKRCAQTLVNRLIATHKPSLGNTVFVLHTGDESLSIELAELVADQVPYCDLHIAEVGPIIGTHLGYGAMAVLFWASER